jgi:futalosine hydrolase
MSDRTAPTSPGELLLVAATEPELCGFAGIVCGVGPVDAAAATARALSEGRPRAVLHVGVAGGRGIAPGSLVIGTEAVYVDISAAIPVVDRVVATATLVATTRSALPDALCLPIATSAGVSGSSHALPDGVRVEGMEGFAVLRACELAGVPAVELRAVSNALGETDRARWKIPQAIEALGEALPRVLTALSE